MRTGKFLKFLLILTLVSALDCHFLLAQPNPRYYIQGEKCYDKQQFSKAIYYFQKGIEQNQLKALCITGLGRVFYRQEKFKEAEEKFESALKLDPKQYLANKWKGKILVDKGKYRKAIAYFDKAIAANPDKDSPYIFRAGCYSALKEDKSALADLNRAIKIDPKPKNFIDRAEVFCNLKMYKEAIADYTRGQKGEWNKDIVFHRKAFCYEKLGQLNKAAEEFNLLLKQNPKDDEARSKRAEIYLKLDKPQKALDDLNFAIDNYPFGEPRHLYRLRAQAYRKLGLIEKAKIDSEKASSRN